MKVASILKLCKVHKGEHYQNGTCFQLLPCTPLFSYCPWPIWYSQLLINLKMCIYHMYCVIYIFSFSCIWVGWMWVSIKTLLVHSMKSPKGATCCVCVCVFTRLSLPWIVCESHEKSTQNDGEGFFCCFLFH
jgi:fucose 4-O-acetylase-like acetyltransferase